MTRDRWAEWLAERRYGGDPNVRAHFAVELEKRRDRVLANAELAAGDTLLDVGCGEGLIAFGALERGAGTVVFSDVSRDLLELCRETAAARGMLERCRFVEASAADLAGIADASVDVVTTRSVLIYVDDKRSAFREFERVLRAGGRISLYEPINSFAPLDSDESFCGYDIRPVAGLAAKVAAVYDAIQPPGTDPMLDFDERGLIDLAAEAGFFPVWAQVEYEIRPTDARPWQTFLDQAGNPCIPTLAEAMHEALTADERERLTAHLRPLVEAGRGEWRLAHAFVVGVKPTGPR